MKKEFFLSNKKENEILIKSIIHVLKNVNISWKKTKENYILSIFCETCELFTKKNNLHIFLINFIKQIKYLESQKMSYYLLNPEKIYIINDEISFIIDENINEITRDEIRITNIFEKKLCSPELYEVKSLPNKVSLKSIYFSTSLYLLKAFVEIDESVFYRLKEEEDMEKKIYLLLKIDSWLNQIKYSKMYWFIKKNLSINVKNRNLVYI